MKLLTLISLQALFIALLCSAALTEKRGATLDGLIKALGSLYQRKLFPLRDAEEIENLRSQLVWGDSGFPDPRETVTIPRQHFCLVTIPYCVTLYSTLIVLGKPDKQPTPEKKNIRNENEEFHIKPCFSDIVLDSCKEEIGIDDRQGMIDVSNLKINDFCVPGAIELNGTLDVLQEINENSAVYLEINRWPRSSHKGKFDDNISSRCLGGGSYCNVYRTCDLMERDGCKEQRNIYGIPKYPCSCPVPQGTYDMDGFKKAITKSNSFGWGRMSGTMIIMTKRASTCVSFSFTKSLKMF